MPTITYDSRADLHLEERLRDYLDERHRILSLSGPTKSGETVLLSSVLVDPIWLSGGEIRSLDEFWFGVADRLRLPTHTEETNSVSDTTEQNRTVGVSMVGNAATGSRDSSSNAQTFSVGRERDIPSAAREALASNLRVLVVDDFHYIPPEVQLGIVRGLKDLVFRGLPVIFASVPHRAYDAVRVEKEMTGRVEQLSIKFWSEAELARIAEKGFAALNAIDNAGALGRRLAKESFSSPHLMQDFCLQLCKSNGLRETAPEPKALAAPDWPAFFQERGSAASKSAFDLLARGPRQRTDRKPRLLQSGATADIYGVVLTAIAETGPLTELTYEQLRTGMRNVLAEELPQRHEITRVLEEMAKISRDQIEGEPVLDYDAEMSTLHIADPFFAYFLRWGRSN